MGWCSGSIYASDLFDKIEKYIPEDLKIEVASEMYDFFSAQDADCWDSEMKLIEFARKKKGSQCQEDFKDE